MNTNYINNRVVEPSGLVNLGNTCYLNSVVQALRVIPQLRRGIEHYSSSGGGSNNNSSKLLLSSLLSTLNTLGERCYECII